VVLQGGMFAQGFISAYTRAIHRPFHPSAFLDYSFKSLAFHYDSILRLAIKNALRVVFYCDTLG
jgi:hypothetical protein